VKDKRSSQVRLEHRVTEVQKALLNGHTRSAILEQFKSWEVSDRQIDTYIKQATDNIREINGIRREDNLATIVSNQWELFRSLKNDNQLGEARKVLMDIARLRGLDEQTIQHFVNERPLKDIPDTELDQVLGGGDGRH